jgi:hypothetical protein
MLMFININIRSTKQPRRQSQASEALEQLLQVFRLCSSVLDVVKDGDAVTAEQQTSHLPDDAHATGIAVNSHEQKYFAFQKFGFAVWFADPASARGAYRDRHETRGGM